jgi:hypothetical protein
MSSRAIGELSITEIEAPTLVKLIRAIEDRGVHDIAKRALETIGQVYRYAIAHGLSSRNPAADIKPRDILKSIPKRNYARVDAKELPNLLRCIEIAIVHTLGAKFNFISHVHLLVSNTGLHDSRERLVSNIHFPIDVIQKRWPPRLDRSAFAGSRRWVATNSGLDNLNQALFAL